MLWREDTAECPDLPAAERRRLGLADLLDYDVMVRPGVVGLKSGALLAGMRFEGPDRETSLPAKLDQLHQALVRALTGFGDGWVLHYDLRRSARPSYPCTSVHADPVSRHLDTIRRRRFEAEGTCFRSVVHLCFSRFPPSERRGALAELATGDADLVRPEHQLEGFERAFAELCEQLRPYAAIERLDTAALLRHLHTCISGFEHPIAPPAPGVFLDQLLASQDLIAGTRLQIGERHLVPIGFFGAPERELFPGALDFLAGVPATFRYAARVIFLDAATAQARIAAIRSEWARTGFDWRQILAKIWGGEESEHARARLENRFTARMAEDAAEALAEALGGERFAIVTPTVLVEGTTRAEAEEGAAELLGVLRNAGLPARVETLNALQAWLAQLPGNAWCNRRKLLLSTTAAAALLPQTSVWMGSERCPHPDWAGRPPLAVVATASRESFCLNLHVGDVGHTQGHGSSRSNPDPSPGGATAYSLGRQPQARRGKPLKTDRSGFARPCLVFEGRLCRGVGAGEIGDFALWTSGSRPRLHAAAPAGLALTEGLPIEQHVRRLVAEHGSDWVSKWFSENGLSNDAAELAAERSA